MRVVRRAEFMELPPGTLYSKAAPNSDFDGLSIKGETWETDFTCLHLANFDAHDSGQWSERYCIMLEGGESFPMDGDYGRDGCFDYDAVFLIYERTDLLKLRMMIDEAIAVANPGEPS